MNTRSMLPTLAACCAVTLTGCSLRPSYQVRVINDSTSTVIAQLRRDRAMDSDEIMDRARVRPGAEAALGPAVADPLDPVDLLVSRPDDIQSIPLRHRLRRGSYTATIHDAPVSTWHRFTVTVEKD